MLPMASKTCTWQRTARLCKALYLIHEGLAKHAKFNGMQSAYCPAHHIMPHTPTLLRSLARAGAIAAQSANDVARKKKIRSLQAAA